MTALAEPAAQTLVHRGPLLLADITDDSSWAAHRGRLGPVPRRDLDTVAAWCDTVGLRGRGGAGFPFARKLVTAARKRALVVVNASEGEPASHKDAALALMAPHLVLDGAAVAAQALRTREVHVVVPGDNPSVVAAVTSAVEERRSAGERLRWQVHHADARFVAGQARAVLELMAGRENKPVTAWVPEAVSGHRGRPTLLSNAETFAHLAALTRLGPRQYASYGRPGAPGTLLLTLDGDGPAAQVVEVPSGTSLASVLGEVLEGRWPAGAPVLLGGYHGTWLSGPEVLRARLDRDELAAGGATLGAGVVLPLASGQCPVARTADVVRYLAGESAGRCGPCRLGLPAMADELDRLAWEGGDPARLLELAGVVTGRGACAHPDGTARLVRSVLACFPDDVRAHTAGACTWSTTVRDEAGATDERERRR